MISGFSVMANGAQTSYHNGFLKSKMYLNNLNYAVNNLNTQTIEINLLNGNLNVSNDLYFYNNSQGFVGNSYPDYPGYPTLLIGNDTSYFWPINQPVFADTFENETDSSGHNSAIFIYKYNFNNTVNMNSIVASYSSGTIPLGHSDGPEAYLFLNPVFFLNFSIFINYSEYYNLIYSINKLIKSL
ncbi:MAG: hypothetical protein QXZ12_07730 [Thermoplasmata archaeon]